MTLRFLKIAIAALSLTIGAEARAQAPGVATTTAAPTAPTTAPLAPTPSPASAPALPSTAANSGVPPETALDQSYILGPEDVIEIQIIGRSDFSVRARIAQNGTIQLPYLGTVNAADMTTQELSDQLSKSLDAGGYYSHPVLTVEIVSFASRYVTVLGEVATPGLVPIDRPYHLSELLACVGGPRGDAADHIVIRSDKGEQRQYSIEALATGDPSQDPLVAPGDKIFIPKSELFYISGQVKAPGAYSLDTGMTLRQAIARGGGLTDIGNDHGVKATTKDGKSVHLDLDSKIEAGEVIIIGEKLF
jgi:polysaccharide biosynthesis/export protein